MRTGYLVLAPGIAVVAVAALPDVVPFWVIHVGWAVAGLGMGLAYSAHAQAVLRCSPAERYGAATASLQLLDNLGIALGTGAVGVIVTVGHDLGWDPGRAVAVAFTGPIAVALVGAAMSRRFPHRLDLHPRSMIEMWCPPRPQLEVESGGLAGLPGASAEPRGFQSSAGPPVRSRFAARTGTMWRRRSRPGGSLWRWRRHSARQFGRPGGRGFSRPACRRAAWRGFGCTWPTVGRHRFAPVPAVFREDENRQATRVAK